MTDLTPEALQGIVGSVREEITTDEEYQAAMAYISAIEQRINELEIEMFKKIDAHSLQIEYIKDRCHEITDKLKTSFFRQRAICEQYLMDKSSAIFAPCPECNGNGALGTQWMYDPNEHTDLCPACGGTGTGDKEVKYTWAAEVFDLKDLVGAAAINPEYLEFLLPNQTKLNALARKNKSTMRVPGVVAVRKEKS